MRTAFLFISLIILSGCSERKKSAADEAPREPAAFRDSSFASITPMIDGSVYAQDFDGRLWHVRDAVAVQVKSTAGKLPDFSEIIPSADGSAYATSWEAGLWHLVGASASKVAESSQTSGSVRPATAPNALFALYTHERHRRIAAEDRASEAEGMAERASGGERGDGYDSDY
jgi:hypothetical protein